MPGLRYGVTLFCGCDLFDASTIAAPPPTHSKTLQRGIPAMIHVAITGAAGRMGHHLLEACHTVEGLRCTAALEHPDHPSIGADVGDWYVQPPDARQFTDIRAD